MLRYVLVVLLTFLRPLLLVHAANGRCEVLTNAVRSGRVDVVTEQE
jgi:hypothetical protein